MMLILAILRLAIQKVENKTSGTSHAQIQHGGIFDGVF
jgi:hypothetical protein